MNPAELLNNSNGRILFADDDEAFRVGLGKRLSRAGFSCDYAASANEALTLLKTNDYDALLSDINMPGNAGLEMIESVPSISQGLPIILLTGNPTVDTATRSVRLRVTAYLTKPPDFAELCAVLITAVADVRRMRTVTASRSRLKDWDQEIELIQKLLQHTPSAGRQPVMQSYLRLTLRNLVVGLIELENLLVKEGDHLGTDEAIQKQQLLAALHKTIAVLQKTRDHFKSKELGELRKELELLASAATTSAATPSSDQRTAV